MNESDRKKLLKYKQSLEETVTTRIARIQKIKDFTEEDILTKHSSKVAMLAIEKRKLNTAKTQLEQVIDALQNY